MWKLLKSGRLSNEINSVSRVCLRSNAPQCGCPHRGALDYVRFSALFNREPDHAGKARIQVQFAALGQRTGATINPIRFD
jgi:hypothetical protein